ncbi:hypothetical protein [Solirubrobacter soli]|uniref:hypothetical protein n=1 Tax=Solirubrobacter soli TaxID=363832 RepID=UPI000413C9B6|nr:hypothetical protein [Solirubrobacter soli]
MTDRLIAIGDDLERAARKDLRRHTSRRRRVIGGAVALAILVPGGALAAGLLSTEEVERSMPAGTKFLVGTTPKCEVVEEGVEYHCTVAGKFNDPEISDMKGTVEPTVDATKHVNGGCRSLRSDGREWTCYIGQEAVRQKIVGPDFLGEYAPAPGVG